jgi:hypothetical protein
VYLCLLSYILDGLKRRPPIYIPPPSLDFPSGRPNVIIPSPLQTPAHSLMQQHTSAENNVAQPPSHYAQLAPQGTREYPQKPAFKETLSKQVPQGSTASQPLCTANAPEMKDDTRDRTRVLLEKSCGVGTGVMSACSGVHGRLGTMKTTSFRLGVPASGFVKRTR